MITYAEARSIRDARNAELEEKIAAAGSDSNITAAAMAIIDVLDRYVRAEMSSPIISGEFAFDYGDLMDKVEWGDVPRLTYDRHSSAVWMRMNEQLALSGWECEYCVNQHMDHHTIVLVPRAER